jgi:tetratricopeptide (TPR) repeat protein
MARSGARVGAWRVALALAAAPAPAFAVSAGDAPNTAQRTISEADRESETIKQVIANARATQRTPEQRIADADLLLRSKDYPRAITQLHEVVEKYPDHPTAYPDALSMLGEGYFQSRQLLSARRAFREIVDKGADPRMAPYAPKAFGRLVDIALRTHNAKDLDDLLAKMGAGTGDATLQYARAKALLSKRDYAGSKAAAGGVPAGHMLFPQAKYILGVVAMREAQATAPQSTLPPGEKPPPAPPTRFAGAIEIFRQVTQLSPDTPEHRRVIDLAWLAIGRLFYEADQWIEAADAYNHVDRQSSDFGTSLYELAWVYVRLGDADKATRALEILSIADPSNAFLADGTLLRADLMLRSGQFDKALTVYQSVRAEYDPMRERVDSFLGSTSDPAVYYDKLASEALETVDQTTQLPSLAVRWAREEQDGPAAFAVLDDVTQCRELLKQSQSLVQRLRALLGSPNRIRAFPELKAGDERALQLLNRLTQARIVVAQGLDDAEPKEVSGELAAIRGERRDLQRRAAQMPMTDADMAEREASAQRQWNKVSQRLQQLQLEVDQLQAIVNGLRRMIAEGTAGVTRDPTAVSQWRTELEANERDLRAYKDVITQTRRQIESGKMQVGYGDSRFVEDDQVRIAFRDKLKQELEMVAAGQGGGRSQSYAGSVSAVMANADASEQKLFALRREIDVEVVKHTTEVDAIITREEQNIAGYAQRLEVLDQEARLVVGHVAMRNFGLVRDKLKGIVLRADVGSVEQAWEVREEQITRVRNLQVERVREEQILQEELREVLDDAADPAGEKPSP